MNWFGKKKSSNKKKRSSNKRPSNKRSSSKRSSRVCFVNGKPKTVRPKPSGSGYYYTRKTSSGNIVKVSVTGKTYTKTQALAKIRKSKK